MRRLIWFFGIAVLVLSACSTWTALAGGGGDMRGSPFQTVLDRHGIPFETGEGKSLLVNIPAFELIAFDKGTPVFRSRVIVGTPWHPTPVFATRVKTVRFNPTWRPTPSMIASGEYRDKIWPPGPENPLGLAAVRLDLSAPIYLHDTNRRALFAEEMRALSHGCIRVAKWDRLISWILDIPLAEVHRQADGGRTRDVPADPIPVTVGYFLSFPDDAGRLQHYGDIYRRGVSVAPAPLAVTGLPASQSCLPG